MTKKQTRNTTLYFRVNPDQNKLVQEAYKAWLATRPASEDKLPTLSEFVREAVMLACLKKLRVLELIFLERQLATTTNEEIPTEKNNE